MARIRDYDALSEEAVPVRIKITKKSKRRDDKNNVHHKKKPWKIRRDANNIK